MSLGELIPQIFYDAIARFVAGLVIIGTAMAVWWTELETVRSLAKEGLEGASLVTAAVFLTAAYVLTLLLEGTREICRRVRDKLIGTTLEDAQAKSSQPKPYDLIWAHCLKDFRKVFHLAGKDPPRPSEAIAIDAVRLEDSDVGARIVKLRAETALCGSLLMGWLLIAFMYAACAIWAWLTQSYTEAAASHSGVVTLLCLGVACFAVSFRRRRLAHRATHALYNHWLLLVDPTAKTSWR